MEIEDRVLLLGIYKKREDESLLDVVLILEDSGVFSFKDGKKRLKALKNGGFIADDKLTIVGLNRAKEIEREFKI